MREEEQAGNEEEGDADEIIGRSPKRTVSGASMQEADILESRVADAVSATAFGRDLQTSLAEIDLAIELRTRLLGPCSPTLIWPLSLKIALLGYEHSRESTMLRALVGEKRLNLRRIALEPYPNEIVLSLRELAGLYSFEDECLDTGRCEALRGEAQRLEEGVP